MKRWTHVSSMVIYQRQNSLLYCCERWIILRISKSSVNMPCLSYRLVRALSVKMVPFPIIWGHIFSIFFIIPLISAGHNTLYLNISVSHYCNHLTNSRFIFMIISFLKSDWICGLELDKVRFLVLFFLDIKSLNRFLWLWQFSIEKSGRNVVNIFGINKENKIPSDTLKNICQPTNLG